MSVRTLAMNNEKHFRCGSVSHLRHRSGCWLGSAAQDGRGQSPLHQTPQLHTLSGQTPPQAPRHGHTGMAPAVRTLSLR